MKINKQYDLLRKIKHSKDGVSANEIFYDYFKSLWSIIPKSYLIIKNTLLLGVKYIPLSIFEFVTSDIITYGFAHFLSLIKKEAFIEKAEYDLLVLVNELSKLEVKTSVELLKEAQINQINYKIKYEDKDKIPKLVQYKYIDIPLSNGYEETLLQEHTYGDKDYELSVNSPVKKMNYKVATNMI